MSERHRNIVDEIMAEFEKGRREERSALMKETPLGGNHRQRYRRARRKEYRREFKEADRERLLLKSYAIW